MEPQNIEVRSQSVQTRIPINGEINYKCEECFDTGFVDVGEYDVIKTVNCPHCNPKTSIEEQMDDNSDLI